MACSPFIGAFDQFLDCNDDFLAQYVCLVFLFSLNISKSFKICSLEAKRLDFESCFLGSNV